MQDIESVRDCKAGKDGDIRIQARRRINNCPRFKTPMLKRDMNGVNVRFGKGNKSKKEERGKQVLDFRQETDATPSKYDTVRCNLRDAQGCWRLNERQPTKGFLLAGGDSGPSIRGGTIESHPGKLASLGGTEDGRLTERDDARTRTRGVTAHLPRSITMRRRIGFFLRNGWTVSATHRSRCRGECERGARRMRADRSGLGFAIGERASPAELAEVVQVRLAALKMARVVHRHVALRITSFLREGQNWG